MMEQHVNPRRSAISILWLGDGRRPEFAPTFEALAARAGVVACRGLSEAELPASDFTPALVIVAQGFAGEIDEADVVRLRRRYPTAALVRIAASWCEGELRSAPLIHGAKRYVAHQALPSLLADLTRLEHGFRPDWGLPATATDEESSAAALDARPSRLRNSVRVDIAASDPQVERWLRDLCRQALVSEPAVYKFQTGPGFEIGPVVQPDAGYQPSTKPTLVLWDVPHGSTAAAAMEFDRLKRSIDVAVAMVVALANFPRRDLIEVLRAAGVAEVVGKPLTKGVLLACIAQAIERIES